VDLQGRQPTNQPINQNKQRNKHVIPIVLGWFLVGTWSNAFEKYYARQIASFLLGIGVKLRNIWNQHLENHLRKKFEYMDYLFVFPVVEKRIKLYVTYSLSKNVKLQVVRITKGGQPKEYTPKN